jgi:hypothetical protein
MKQFFVSRRIRAYENEYKMGRFIAHVDYASTASYQLTQIPAVFRGAFRIFRGISKFCYLFHNFPRKP